MVTHCKSYTVNGFSFHSNITVRKPDNQADQKKINNNNRKKKTLRETVRKTAPNIKKLYFACSDGYKNGSALNVFHSL